MTVADAAVCRDCGHPEDLHTDRCNFWSISHFCNCPAFVADVNRPDDMHMEHKRGQCFNCVEPAAASDRGAGELADILAAHYRLVRRKNIARQECLCGEWSLTNRSEAFVEEQHRAHVAEEIVKTGWEKR